MEGQTQKTAAYSIRLNPKDARANERAINAGLRSEIHLTEINDAEIKLGTQLTLVVSENAEDGNLADHPQRNVHHG